MPRTSHRTSRRQFIASAGKGIVASSVAAGFPAIVPSSVFGSTSPSNRINVGAIGTGRISRGHDLPGIWKYDSARVVAACDLDSHRVADAKTLINGYYAKNTGKPYDGVTGYGDYRELLANKDIDAVVISTPDHWHAIIAIHAVQAGKDVYLQKPASLTIAEGRALSDEVHRSGRIFQIGSQQRSTIQFRYAAELVRNGRIGQLKTVEIGLPGDPSGDEEPTMPVPAGFNYDMWLGSTPVVPYTEKRVHPQKGYDRPGWLRCEQFGAGMITGWGAHHIDSAHWGMDTEYTGPVEIWGTAEFPKKGLWDVHGPFRTEAMYANGVHMIISGDFPNGIKFIGTEGWIFVSRGNETVTDSDPVAKLKDNTALAASDPKIITSVIEPNEIHLYESKEHHGNWLDCIRSRQQTIAPVEVAHRACSACLLHHMAMKTKRKLLWDPQKERFHNDDEANAMLSRPQRPPYTVA
jgi:predicted dehydrogenase